MAQFAVHIATGIYTGDLLKGSKSLSYGLVLGNFAPDLDFVPLVAVYLFDPTLARSFHRSASHSFFIPMLALTISLLLWLVTKKQAIRDWGIGLALGFATHTVFDILFWFDQVKVLWPLDLWGIPTTIDLWQGYKPPLSIRLLIGPAAEFLCYGALYYLLRQRIQRFQSNTSFIPTLRRLEKFSLVVFGLYVVLIFVLPQATFEEMVYGLASFLFAPLTLYLLWRLREAIAGVISTGQ